MDSPALRLFRERAGEVALLLALCSPEDADLPERMKSRKQDAALCRSALVLLCSHMEGFFEDLVSACLEFHERNGTLAGELPLRLRVVQIWRSREPPDGASDECIWRMIEGVRDAPLANDSTVCRCGLLDSELHVHGFATPGSKEVDKLFASAGILDVWSAIAEENTDVARVKTNLDAMVHRRHPVAHGDAGVAPTRGDIESYLSDMIVLAEHFDSAVEKRLIASHPTRTPWSLVSE
jgi:hypothetical protein